MSEQLNIAILDYPSAQKAALYGLMDLFDTAKRLSRELEHNSKLNVDKVDQDVIEQPSTKHDYQVIIIPPSVADGDVTKHNKIFVEWLRRQHQIGSLLCSVCAGAFLLAETGLLDGRQATTHWALKDKFQQQFPRVQVNTEQLLIEDGDIITAGGLMAWLDLGLKIIARFLSPAVMLATARFFLIDPGGREQRFYSTFAPVLNHGDQLILQVQHWLQNNSADVVHVPNLAAMVNLGERTFLRRFVKATGFKPLEYLQHLRIGKARELMETTNLAVEQIAWQVGYQDASAFRRMFNKIIGLTPKQYRERFALAG